MEIILKILRNIEGKEFYQSFRYETKTDSDTVATALTDLNTEVSLKPVIHAPAGASPRKTELSLKPME